MLKFFFWILLLANAALLVYQQGYLEPWIPSGREPARINNQFNADNIKLISPNAVSDALPPPAPSEPQAMQATPVNSSLVLACAEIGNFTVDDARRFEAQLATVAGVMKVSQRSVQEVATHLVYIPSQGSREGADKKAEELRRMGVNEFYIIQDNSDLRWGISLGVFRYEDAARMHLTNLAQKGVRNARMGERSVPVRAIAFQVRELDRATKEAILKISAGFPRQEMRDCKAI